MSSSTIRIDGHLDLAHNALYQGRDLDLPLEGLRAQEGRERETAMVTWPELRDMGMTLVFGTLFAAPFREVSSRPGSATAKGYRDAEEAHALAKAQLDYYQAAEDRGWIRILRSRQDLDEHVEQTIAAPAATRRVGLVVLMEGADPIRKPEELEDWWRLGVRLLGPAWQRTRYCGGTHEPGGLTDIGRELMQAMTAIGVPLDVSHLAEEAFWEALDLHRGSVLASHVNARAITPTDRHLSDDMLDALARRDAVVGLVLGDRFIDPEAERGTVALSHLARQARHIADRVGWQRVAIGSDLDGGFGLEESPIELGRIGDWDRLAEIAPAEHQAGLLGENWLGFLRRCLPPQ